MPEYLALLNPKFIDKSFKGTRQDLISNYINKMPIIDAIFKLVNIDRLLYRTGYSSKKSQVFVINQIAKISKNTQFHTLANRLKSIVLDNKNPQTIVFHHLQIYYCLSLLLLHNKFHEGHIDYQDVAIVLLKINYLIDQKSSTSFTNKPSTLLWNHSQFYLKLNRNPEFEMARVYSVFYKTNSGGLFREKFKEVFRFELIEFWLVCFALYSSWISPSRDDGFYDFALNLDEYKNILKVDFEVVRDVFDEMSSDVNNLSKIHRQIHHDFKNLDLFHNFFFLEEHPLLKHNNQYLILSLHFFIKWVYTDVISYCLDRFKRNNVKITGEFGKAYEEYIQNIMKESVDNSNKNRDRLHFVEHNKIQISDGVLDYDNALVFIEIKATLKRYLMWGCEENHIKNRLKEFFYQSSNTHKHKPQLQKRINEFREGKTIIPGINPKKIDYYWPILIVCRAELPQFSDLYDLYNQFFIENNAFQEEYFKPVTIIDIREWEMILELLEEDYSLISILEERHKFENKELSLRDVLIQKYKKVNEPKRLINRKRNVMEVYKDFINQNYLNDPE